MKCGVNAVMLYCDPTKFELRSTRELQVILTTTTNGHFIQQSLGGSKVATVYERRIEALENVNFSALNPPHFIRRILQIINFTNARAHMYEVGTPKKRKMDPIIPHRAIESQMTTGSKASQSW